MSNYVILQMLTSYKGTCLDIYSLTGILILVSMMNTACYVYVYSEIAYYVVRESS